MDRDNSKIKVVLLTDSLGDITGGAEKQIFELGKRLPKDRYEVHIASMEAKGKTSQALIESIGCHFHAFRVVRIYGWTGLIHGLRFFAFLRKNSVHALMTYHCGSDIWGAFWGRLAGVPVIISNRRDMGFWRGPQHIRTYRMFNSWVNHIVVVASCVGDMVSQDEGVRPDKIKLIPNGVDLPQVTVDVPAKRKELGINPLDTVIMHVANLRTVKGHKYLIEAFAKVKQQFVGLKLVLIGRDELDGRLQELAERLNIKSSVLFLGQRRDVHELLAVSDICVLPSLSEGMSNSILEYMSFGKPVIATRVGGNPELVKDGYNGLLVEKANSEQLAKALLELVQSQDRRRQMGANGRDMVKIHFSMQLMMRNYEKILS